MNLQPDEDETEDESDETFAGAFSIFDPENAALYAKVSEELVTLNTDLDPAPVLDGSEGKSTSSAGKPHLFHHQSGSPRRVTES